MLPFSEPFSHEWPMFCLFDCDQEIGAGQIVDCARKGDRNHGNADPPAGAV
jgi:hypothetical protein